MIGWGATCGLSCVSATTQQHPSSDKVTITTQFYVVLYDPSINESKRTRSYFYSWFFIWVNLFQARHTTYGIRKCFLFLLQCQLSLVILQVRDNTSQTQNIRIFKMCCTECKLYLITQIKWPQIESNKEGIFQYNRANTSLTKQNQ